MTKPDSGGVREALVAARAAIASVPSSMFCDAPYDEYHALLKKIDAALSPPPTAGREEDHDRELYRRRSSYLAPSPSAEPVACDEGQRLPTYGNLPWDHIGRDVMEALTDRRLPFKFDEKFYPGHQSTGINFNSLARIIDKYRLAGSWQGIAPASPVSDASREAWQPIETAPKDGTRCDVWSVYTDAYGSHGARYANAQYKQHKNSWFDTGGNTLDWEELDATDDNKPRGRKTTHWMPEPSPPNSFDKTGDGK